MPEVDPLSGGRSGGRGLPADEVVVAKLRAGDENMFAALLVTLSPAMLRIARTVVADDHTAEDVLQDAWLAVVRGIERFEGRSSLRTWIHRIVINRAKTRALRDARAVPMADLAKDDSGPTVDPESFTGPDNRHPGSWHARSAPTAWPTPETDLLAKEIHEELDRALDALPARQRIVITLRDIAGYSYDEVCDILEITPANQRVLLHRARASVRAALDLYLKTA